MATSNANSAGSVSKLPPFELERFFAKYEFTAPYIAVRARYDLLKNERNEL